MAGFVCGFALALIATPLGALALVRLRVNSKPVAQLVPAGVSLTLLSIVLHTAAFLLFTAIGIVLGLVLWALEDRRPADGLGSPNGVFTAIVLIGAVMVVIPPLVALPRQRLAIVVAGLVLAATFGWAMPYLSLLGPES
jgi:hypothetical protein